MRENGSSPEEMLTHSFGDHEQLETKPNTGSILESLNLLRNHDPEKYKAIIRGLNYEGLEINALTKLTGEAADKAGRTLAEILNESDPTSIKAKSKELADIYYDV